ncbi:hypothetical protein [Cellulomonas hominis]
MTTTRTTIALAAVAVLASVLTGCSASSTPTPDPTSESPTVSASASSAPAETAPAPAPGPTADAYSQVISGTLYQGTEKAPVRIGTDIPGQPPAAEAGFPSGNEGWKDYAQEANKYVITFAPSYSGGQLAGWLWKAFGVSQYESFREVGNSGYQQGVYLPDRAAAFAGPFIVDGRTLDRSEYILAPIADRFANVP